MANEDKKDFNQMLYKNKDMPKMQIITDEAEIKKYGGEKMKHPIGERLRPMEN